MAEHVCPVWIGYLLASPVRKLFQHPHKILSPYVKEGLKVLDVGCAMGFFSVPLAQMVGSPGKVICVDLQAQMLAALEKRAQKAGLSKRIETRLCQQHSLGLHDLQEEIDFALVFAIVHEVSDSPRFFSEIYATLRPGGRGLVAEPKGHVAVQEFKKTVAVAQQTGFTVIDTPQIARSHSVLLEKTR